jgi:glutamate racemase
VVVLDSGLGGLTVVQALRRVLPDEDIIYFGDTARLPYGNKTAGTDTRFVREIINFLRPFDPKHVVIACNTASALALPNLPTAFGDLSISGVINPGARAAVARADKAAPTIAVIATEATTRSRAYAAAITACCPQANVLLRATPLLVPIIEEGRSGEDPLVAIALRQYLDPIVRRKPDVLVLGCTHYPILKHAIQQLVGETIAVIDSADQCAEDVSRRLRACGLARSPHGQRGVLKCFVTDDSPRFAVLGSRFLGMEIASPTLVAPDDLYAGVQVDGPAVVMRPAI